MDNIAGERRREIKYSPLSSQRAFHRSRARFKGFSGSIGSGKSAALCHEAIKLSYLNPGRTGLVGAPTYPMLRDATLMALTQILEANELPFDLNKSELVLTMKDTGSKLLLRSLDEYERLRGTNLSWFGVDELTYVREEAWLRLEGRLRDPQAKRLCGFAVWTPKGHDWVYKRFIGNRVDGYELIQAKPFENRFILDQIPDFYERLKSSYDQKFFQQEVLGEYLATETGLVYHSFSRTEHVGELRLELGLPLLWAVDFNVDPMCSVVAQRIGEQIHVLDEIVMNRVSTRQACEEFMKRFYRFTTGGLVVYGDASGNNLKTSGTTDYEMMREFFTRSPLRAIDYRVPKANPAVRDRVLMVNAKLRTADGGIQMKIAPQCKELIKDFEEVVWKSGTTQIDKDRDSRRTHLSDALGYLVWQETRASVRYGEQPQRLF